MEGDCGCVYGENSVCVEGEMIVCVCVATGDVWRDRGECVWGGDGGVCVQRDCGVVVEGVEGGCGAKNGCVWRAVGNR